jgi:membrane protein DedA with SNARE-associated domain
MQGWIEAAGQAVIAFVRAHIEYTEIIVAILGFSEGIALVSLFVPSTFLFLVIGGVHSAAGGHYWTVWLAGAAGAVLGDVVSYGLGRWFKDDVQKVWPFSRYPALLPQSRALFERWGILSILFGKFVGGLRPFIPVVAGTLAMPLVLFMIGSVISSLAWAGIFLAPGYGISWLW